MRLSLNLGENLLFPLDFSYHGCPRVSPDFTDFSGFQSWSVPVYTGAKIVALLHTAPHVTDNLQRIADVETFYNVATPNSVRNKIVKKYGVTHIFLHFRIDGRQLEPMLLELGYSVVVRTDVFSIFRVSKRLPGD